MANWKRVIGWSAISILGVIVLVIVAGIVVVHTSAFHDWVLAKIESTASEDLNAQVKVGRFDLSLSHLTLDLYNVSIHTTGPVPLLHVAHLGASVKIISALHREWSLNDIQVDQPIVHLIVDKNGNSNLPHLQSSSTNSHTNVFDLAVKRAVLDRGEVYYNDQKSDLDANLKDLQFQSSWDPANGGRYYGTLGYKQGLLRFGNYAPLPHDLSAHFSATRSELTIDGMNLAVGNSHLRLRASVQNYADPVVAATYDASLDATQFRKMLKNAALPEGTIHLEGTAEYRSRPNQPMLNAISVEGGVDSRALLVRQPTLNTEIRAIAGHYKISNGNAALTSFKAGVLGGEITLTAALQDLAGTQHGRVHAVARGISAADLRSLANSASLKDVSVTGQLNATADATWSGSMNNLVAGTDAELQAALANRANGSTIPVNAAIHARYNGSTKTIALRRSYVHLPETSVTLDGTMATHSKLQIQVRSNNLGELETLADLARTPAPGQAALPPIGLRGTAIFTGELSGTTANPHLTGQLSANNLRVHGSSWRQLRTAVALSPSSVALQNGLLIPAAHGRITFNLQVGLNKWSYSASNPLAVMVNANQLSVQEIEQAASVKYPASGTLNLQLSLHGSERNPIGNGSLSIVNAKVEEEPIQSLNVKFNGTGQVVHATLAMQIPAGVTQATLTYYPQNEGYEAVLKAANLQLAKIQTLRAQNMQIAGVLNVNLSGRGTFANPELQATITVPQLQVKDQQLKGISLQANVANHVGTFALNSEVVNTYVTATGKVDLTGDYMAEAKLDTRGIPLQPIFSIYIPAQAPDMTGQTELHATVRGPLKHLAQMEAHLTIPVLRVGYQQLQIAAAKPIQLDYVNDVLTVQPSEITGTDTDLRFGGRVPLQSGAPASLSATGTLDLQLAEIFSPGLKSSGEIKFAINSAGNLSNPNLEGTVNVVNANFMPEDAPVGLENGNGVLTLTRDRLQVTSFTGSVGGGKIQATGAIIYRPAIQFSLALAGEDMRVLYANAIRVGASTKLALTGNFTSAYLRGDVQLTHLSFTPNFDLMSFVSQFSGGGGVSAPSGGLEQNLHLAINVQSTAQLDLVSKGLSIQGNANLRVVGTADSPVILGRATISGGDIILNGNRFVLQSGSIEFVNPVETEPIVNLAAKTTIDQYNIDIRLHGPSTELQTTYNSDPALPPVDIINLLAFGKTTEAGAQTPTTGTMGAESVVASGLSSQITSKVAKIAGISQLSIDPGLGEAGNTGPRIAVQQRVTSNLFVTFSTYLSGTQDEQVQVEYRLTPKWSVSATRDQNGGFGFDALAHKEY